MILYLVFERPPFFQAFKMRSLSKLLVFETKATGHATAIAAFFNFNVQITATQDKNQKNYSEL